MIKNKLRVLVVTQYFWPENMRINDLVRDFSESGHEVVVLTGWPNYPEGSVFSEFSTSPERFKNYFGARIVRVPLVSRGKCSVSLILNYISFFLSASTLGVFKLRSERFDAVFVYAVSPIMAAIPAVVLGRIKKVPVFVWILDLWPDTLRAVGVLRQPTLLSLVGRVVSTIYNRADYLLLQSKGFADNVKQYCTKEIPPERLIYFPSWAEDDFSSSTPLPSSLLERDDSVFTIVFAGNLGEAQDFPAILEAAEALRSKIAVRWVIVGDGRMSKWLHEQVTTRNLSNVLLLGRHPLSEMPGVFACADGLLVSLKTHDIFEKTIPGKIQAYMASSKPILGMINGEAARVIEESGAGFSCPSGDVQGLVRVTLELATKSSAQREAMGRSGRSYYLNHYSKSALMERLEVLFRVATLRRTTQ
ncbi:glycosyl transferase [Pseudomonas sp. Leaf48]|uniref:glycosyltransferase family 4 protein n=1 Tax=Pseudomonas sp. Leaf48 TaxID=1736221 RepID=UPI0007288C38|nr:glycosyltransferase family 4 protein [Pseudomonas sp. Leaf48]KQN47103.1 glycosyl transferase [Pseudomonas sp. Leaf48]